MKPIKQKQILMLKQIGYSSEQIEFSIKKSNEKGMPFLDVIRDAFPGIEGRVVSLDWRPSKNTIKMLVASGYFREIIESKSGEFTMESIEKGRVIRDMDAYFLKWIQSRVNLIKSCDISEWVPEWQVKEMAITAGFRKYEFEGHLKTYQRLVLNRNEKSARHGFDFFNFMLRMRDA